jgi:nucleoside-diphosphate-sugar epimerase
MRVLLTGSSGQIGTNLGLRLQRDGHEVFGVDNRPNAWTDDFPYLLQDLAGHQELLSDDGDGGTYPDVDVVVHLAAHAKVHQLVHQPRRALENTVMTFNVLEYARQRNIPIVFSSSREVYGDVHRFEAYGEQVADFALTESTYSASKIAGEAFVYSYARCYGLRYLVFRFSNVYGRFDNDLDRMVRVIPLFIHSMLRDEPVTVFGGNAKTLDFTYIDDCVEGVVRGIESLVDGTVVNQTINLAYGQGNTLVHCAERIAAELGVRPRMTIAPSLLGEVTHYVADLSKAREFLDYDPQVTLDVGIQRAVAWFREHRDSHPEEDRPVTAHYEATSRALQIEGADDLAQRRRRERAHARVIEPGAAPGTRSAQQA